MKRNHFVLASIFILAAVGFAASSTAIIKVSRLSDTEAGISCKNGADPTGKMIGNTLIISCGK